MFGFRIMTKRDFLILMLRLFALLFFIDFLFNAVPTFLQYTFLEWDAFMDPGMIGLFLGGVILFLFLLLKAPLVVDRLKLDKGYDEEKRMDLEKAGEDKLMQLALIIIGFWLLIDPINQLLTELIRSFYYVVGLKSDAWFNHENYAGFWNTAGWKLVEQGLRAMVGFLILNNSEWLSKKLRKKETDREEGE